MFRKKQKKIDKAILRRIRDDLLRNDSQRQGSKEDNFSYSTGVLDFYNEAAKELREGKPACSAKGRGE